MHVILFRTQGGWGRLQLGSSPVANGGRTLSFFVEYRRQTIYSSSVTHPAPPPPLPLTYSQFVSVKIPPLVPTGYRKVGLVPDATLQILARGGTCGLTTQKHQHNHVMASPMNIMMNNILIRTVIQ